MGHFLGQPNESSPRLERFAAQQAWQSDLLGKSQKTGLWPWTQLSASPRTVLFRWNVVDHVDHAAPRAPRRWTTARPRKGRRGAGEDAAVDAHVERSTRVHWFGCGVRLPSP